MCAQLAAQHGVPFAALRVIADPAHRTLPEAAMVGMRPDGGMDAPAVMRALLRRPGDIPALIRTALDAGAAFRALKRDRASLAGPLAFLDAIVVDGKPTGLERSRVDGGLFLPASEMRAENG